MRRLTWGWRRVGFQETTTTLTLPETISQLHASWDVLVKPDSTPVWDFLWDSKVDENREKGLLQTAFTTDNDDITLVGDAISSPEIQVAEAALKVCRRYPPRMSDADLMVRWCLGRQMRITYPQEEQLY